MPATRLPRTAPPAPPGVTRPALPPVVYLRGAGIPQELWDRVETEMWRRGCVTVHDRLSAWHLCRGGAPLVMVDFSDELDDNPPAPGGGTWHGYNRYVLVGLVRARYRVTKETGRLDACLDPRDEHLASEETRRFY